MTDEENQQLEFSSHLHSCEKDKNRLPKQFETAAELASASQQEASTWCTNSSANYYTPHATASASNSSANYYTPPPIPTILISMLLFLW
jgi:hypothetical protein